MHDERCAVEACGEHEERKAMPIILYEEGKQCGGSIGGSISEAKGGGGKASRPRRQAPVSGGAAGKKKLGYERGKT